MGELTQVLEDVRNKIAQYQGKEMNEQNTKRALIDPVLCALGWKVGNLEEVSQEYKRRSNHKPVDYALFLLRTPKLFVEAKALGQGLDAPKWTNQIMGYAAVGGVKWVVMSNGEEWRIYNACVEVPVEEKLFRSVRLSDPTSPTAETLALLSKHRIRDNDIEVLWKAHFVDRQVLSALEQLFLPDPDPSLVRLVKRRVRELSSKEIHASLNRVRARFDFPVEPDLRHIGHGKGGKHNPSRSLAAQRAWETRRCKKGDLANMQVAGKKSPKSLVVSLLDLIEAGLLKPPLKLTKHYKGKDLEAKLLPDGAVRFQGKKYETCSKAATFARGTIAGRRMNTNGWTFWRYLNQDGKLVPLNNARQALLKRKAK